MSKSPASSLPPETQAMLDCLRRTNAKTLDRKRRLGHYAVLWDGQRPVLVGEDAPQHPQQTEPGQPAA